MKLVSYAHAGDVRLGALIAGNAVVDLQRASGGTLPSTMIEFLAQGDAAMETARSVIGTTAGASASNVIYALHDPLTHLEAPVPRPGKVLAVGLNYRDHAEESGQAIPERPVVFAKMATCITGPGMPIHRPKVSAALDWEGELCFVIGKKARHVQAPDALSYVAGYAIGNDVSVRDWQFHSPTWVMGKGFDTHGPLGPWLVTRDEIPDPGTLDVKTWVNGELQQSSNTRNLIFGIGAIVEYLTAAFTLEPGDVVYTGTPAGVGVARKPPHFMKAGDVVRVEISGLGVLENPVIEEP